MYTTPMALPRRIVAWADADQELLLRDFAERDSLQLLAVGCNSSDGAARLSTALEVQRVDDVRRAALLDGSDALWLAGAAELDAATLRMIRERGHTVFTSQPYPASLGDLPAQAEEATCVRFTAPMRRSEGYRFASEVIGEFGPARCVNVTMRSGIGQGGLFARLFDAVDVIESLCGEPEVIDAALVSPMPGGSNIVEDLAGLHGHMTINMRFSENRCACVAASDLAGTWFRGVTVLGDDGCLRISDDGFEWIAQDGQVLESHDAAQPSSPGSLIAEYMLRALDRLDVTDAPPDAARLLAICEAARLSCRTGEGESPRKMLKMLSHV